MALHDDERRDRLHLGIRGADRGPLSQIPRKRSRRFTERSQVTTNENVLEESPSPLGGQRLPKPTPLGGADLRKPIPLGGMTFDVMAYTPEEGRQGLGVQIGSHPTQLSDRAQEKIERAASMRDKITDLEATGTVEQQAELNQLKEEIAVMLEEAEFELMQAQDQLGVQDVISESQWDLAGLPADMQLTDLSDALEVGQGIHLTTAEDMKRIANDPNLTQEEKNKAFDLITNRQKFSEEIARTITDLTHNVQLLKEAEQRPDTALLGQPLEFFNPTINFATVGESDEDRWYTNTLGELEETVVADKIAALPENDPSLQLYEALLVAVADGGVDNPQAQQIMRALEQAWGADGITYDVLYRAFGEAAVQANLRQEAWDQALDDKTPLVPGSQGMIAAIAQSAEEITYGGESIDPEIIDLLAKSKDLHWIIDVMSNGEHGKQVDGGTKAGIGGLTEDMYQYLMGEEWTPTRGKQWEIEALIRYVFELYGGDPIAAVNAWRTTGEWGGVGVDLGG